MKNLIYIFLFITTFAAAQSNISVKGYYNAHRGDSIGKNRTTLAKAQTDCEKLGKTNYKDELIYITPPLRWVYTPAKVELNTPVYNSEIQDIDIVVTSVNSTTANIHITNNFDNVDYVYIEFYADGEPKQQTTKGLLNIYSAKELTPNTDYYFTVYFAMTDGTIKTSNILTFKTK